jgi:hypothetical protein
VKHHWTAGGVVAVIIGVTLTVGTLGVVLVAIQRGEPLSSQAIGIVSVVWGAMAGGLSAWLGSQGDDDPPDPTDDVDE